MNDVPAILFAAVVAYGVGSLPFGYLAAKWRTGHDIRTQGSGNIGATNVARVLGKRWGALVLALDGLKGWLPVFFLPRLLLPTESTHAQVACATAAVVGHMFPCWLGFRGGKGVATALGVVLVLSWPATAAALAVFLAVLAVLRMVALASMTAAVAFAAVELWRLLPAPFGSETWSLAVFSILVPVLIIYRHRSNIARMLQGNEEPLLGSKPKRPGTGSHGNQDSDREKKDETSSRQDTRTG